MVCDPNINQLELIVKTTTQPQLNQTKPNNQQINKSWVLHENDFAHHRPHPTPPTETLISALEQYRPTLGQLRAT